MRTLALLKKDDGAALQQAQAFRAAAAHAGVQVAHDYADSVALEEQLWAEVRAEIAAEGAAN